MPKHTVAAVVKDNQQDEANLAHAKRFKPQDVIKMGPNARVPCEKQNPDEAPTEKQLSEAEIQLKNMVKKQLDKNITLKSELARESRFLPAAIYKEDQDKRAGALSLLDFKHCTTEEQKLQDLRNYCLTDREIEMKLPDKIRNPSQLSERSGLGLSDVAVQRAINDVAEKIQSRETALSGDISYSNARQMTRHEMEIEQSLYRGTQKAEELKHLITQKPKNFSNDDPVMQTLKEYEDRERRKRSREKKTSKAGKKSDTVEEDSDDSDDGASDVFVGPLLAPLHVRVKPLDEAEVRRNRLNIDEIRSISKFKNYDPGIPSKVLYIKNLPNNTSKEDLAKLFVRFESADNPAMDYRVLDGRMKGQAFVTFKGIDTAKRALAFANGFILKDKPIIIAYGKGKEK